MANAPDPTKPANGSTSKTGKFADYPVNLTAGGPIKTNLGGVDAYVNEAPDFRLNYTSEAKATLKFRVESDGDVTILIYLPDGNWKADRNSGAGGKPYLEFPYSATQGGTYLVWVGTVGVNSEPETKLILKGE